MQLRNFFLIPPYTKRPEAQQELQRAFAASPHTISLEHYAEKAGLLNK